LRAASRIDRARSGALARDRDAPLRAVSTHTPASFLHFLEAPYVWSSVLRRRNRDEDASLPLERAIDASTDRREPLREDD
jgi:hypothetical protein